MNCPHCGKTINEEAKKESVPTGAPSPGAVHKADPKQPIQNEPQDGKLPKDAPPAPGVPSAKSGKTESVPATAPSPGQLKHPVDPKTPKTNAPQVGKVVPGGAAPGGVMTTVKKAQGASGKAVESKEEDDKKAKEKKEAEDKKNEGRVPADPTALDTEEDYIKALLEKLI